MSLRATYKNRGASWEGAIKSDSGAVIATCGHSHYNRDQSTHRRGQSAMDCARRLLSDMTGVPLGAFVRDAVAK